MRGATSRRAMGLCAALPFTLLAGCCVSYHRVAKTDLDATEAANLVALVGDALKAEGRSGVKIESDYGGYVVRKGMEVVQVRIDEQERAIHLGWDWRAHSLPEQVQLTIVRNYGASYHRTLNFADVPCGVFGP